MFWSPCENCRLVKSQNEIIKSLSEEITRIKKHYREDVAALNLQLVMERKEFENIGIEIKESLPEHDMTDLYKHLIQTRWRGNQRAVYYPSYFKDLVVEVKNHERRPHESK